MKEELLDRESSMMVPLLVGGFFGAGTALLFAPKPGKKIRKDLRRMATITRDQVSEVVDKGKEIYEESRKAVSNAVETGKKTYEVGIGKLEKLTKTNERSILMPILAGGVIGAGMALLLAPKSGKEMRDDLKQFAVTAGERASETVDKGKVLYREGKTALTHAMEAGKKIYTEGIEKFRHIAA
jgi:gas vesicle protein